MLMTDNMVIIIPTSNIEPLLLNKKSAKTNTVILLEKSKITIKFLLLNISAIAPPIGENIIIGIEDTASIVANISALPVISSMYKDKANLSIDAPNNEII
ncbi:hypothetical protein JSCD14_21820 [Clostridioides difficile]|nr:hypothetical protein TNHP173_25100 [Clostridioides difficile]GMK61654.1 hypothetical protein JSCD1_15380 [Clostridioides difficile]GMK64911.1 hypothetical protein JSCD2_12400 [Clostridioides difficile]GMK68715.1 hypothetical protein JSCD3_15090 [Clostridioides difficile]GMK73151.1 hypothetical protein JSCD4_23210 [Clostridioides difficile]